LSKRNAVVVIVSVMCLVLAALLPARAASDLRVVRLSEVVRSIFYAPQYVALSEGFFEEEGLRIDLSTAWGADKGAAALISGSVDIGFFGPEAAIYVYNQGARDYIVGFAQLTTMDGSFFLQRSTTDEFSWEDVRGKTIVGARPGGVPEMVLEYVLKKHGITPFVDVEIITNLAFAAAPGAFQAGLGDYIAQFEPAMTELELAGTGKIVASMGLEGGPVSYTVYHARREYLEKNRDTLERFTRALYRGVKWVEEHESAEVAEKVAEFFPDTDLEVLTLIVERYRSQGTWNSTLRVSEEGFENLQTIMDSAGELTRRVPFEMLMDNSIVDAVLSGED
jgi:NitT/TauT family transport system substrate-binding protein